MCFPAVVKVKTVLNRSVILEDGRKVLAEKNHEISPGDRVEVYGDIIVSRLDRETDSG